MCSVAVIFRIACVEMTPLTAEDVKRLLRLKPHPREGGWFRQTYATEERIAAAQFNDARYPTPRRTHTAIYYLLEPTTFSEMHRLRSDEVFHHYAGAPVEMLQLHADGRGERFMLGPDIAAGQHPQLMVARDVWQGSRLLPGSNEQAWALLGCTVAPGFEYEDYDSGTRAELLAEWPEWSGVIEALTHR